MYNFRLTYNQQVFSVFEFVGFRMLGFRLCGGWLLSDLGVLELCDFRIFERRMLDIGFRIWFPSFGISDFGVRNSWLWIVGLSDLKVSQFGFRISDRRISELQRFELSDFWFSDVRLFAVRILGFSDYGNIVIIRTYNDNTNCHSTRVACQRFIYSYKVEVLLVSYFVFVFFEFMEFRTFVCRIFGIRFFGIQNSELWSSDSKLTDFGLSDFELSELGCSPFDLLDVHVGLLEFWFSDSEFRMFEFLVSGFRVRDFQIFGYHF